MDADNEWNGRLWLCSPSPSRAAASILERHDRNGKVELVTESCIFFPGGGGQSPDRGWIGKEPVLSVEELGPRRFRLIVDRDPGGEEAMMELDTEFRMDQSQQHTGQHIISAVAWREFGVATVSVHFGPTENTIELDTPPLCEERTRKLELACNEVAAKGLAIETMPASRAGRVLDKLRKPLPVKVDDPRIVSIDGYDAVPCCGTHLARTSGACPIVFLSRESVRKHARLRFVCGNRALARIASEHRLLSNAAESLNVPPGHVPGRVTELLEELDELRHRLQATAEELCLALFRYESSSRTIGSLKLRCFDLTEAGDADPTRLAKRIRNQERRMVAILTQGKKSGTGVVIVRSEDVTVSCAAIMDALAERLGGKGGGGAGMARGFVPSRQSAEILDCVGELLSEIS